MAPNTERRWGIQNVLGLAIRPYDNTFAELDPVADLLDEVEDAEALEYIRQFFLPQEENVGQVRQAAQRRAEAERWSIAHYGEVRPWLIRAGITPAAAPQDPTPTKKAAKAEK
jgi:hypothetical protein